MIVAGEALWSDYSIDVSFTPLAKFDKCGVVFAYKHPADFYFFGDGLAALRWSLAAARQLRRIVRTNLVLAVAYNAVALSLALAGLVTPVVAAILMPASSLGVVALTAWRLSERRTTWMSS